jgi:hypothetical protein
MYVRMVEKNQIVELRNRLTAMIDVSAMEMCRKIDKLREYVLRSREQPPLEEPKCFTDLPAEGSGVNCWLGGDIVSNIVFQAGNTRGKVEVCCCELHKKIVLDHFDEHIDMEVFEWENAKIWRFSLSGVTT